MSEYFLVPKGDLINLNLKKKEPTKKSELLSENMKLPHEIITELLAFLNNAKRTREKLSNEGEISEKCPENSIFWTFTQI